MLQRKVAEVPAVMPVMVVVGEVGLVMVAVPDSTVQVPVPTIGVLAVIAKVLLLHCSINGTPASAVVGKAKFVTVTSSVLAVQFPFSTRHSNVTDVPAVTPVTVVVADAGLVIVALPETMLQVPVPMTGTVAPIEKELVLQSS